MRIQVLSDLHREFGDFELPEVDCDCVIMAGDVANKLHGLNWLRRRYRDVPVIYICGNHEFYGERMPDLISRLRKEARGSNIHFLENESVTIDGIHFFGCTLWTDLALHGNWKKGAAEVCERMNDFQQIRDAELGLRRLSPASTRQTHRESLDALRIFLGRHDPKKSVVVTHHAPSARSLPVCRREDPVSCGYASRLDSFIQSYQPALWIHGHVHCAKDYLIGKTRVLANPRGYPDEPNSGFDPEMVVDLDGAQSLVGSGSKLIARA